MKNADYHDALALLDRATLLLETREVRSRIEFIYELNRLRQAFDTWRLQIGQPPPALQRN